jgi:taurine dioxygenase
MTDTMNDVASSETVRNGPFTINPLSAALGAEVVGLDLRRPLDPAIAEKIRDAFDRNVVLVIRDQQLSEDDQLRAAGTFGKVYVRRKPAADMTNPGGEFDTPFMLVTNIVENGKSIGVFGDGEMWFHHDTSYYPEPHRATLLYAMKLPSWGGNTCFSNMDKAYDNIPRALRDRLEGKKVLQVHDYKRRERLDLDKIDLAKVRHHEQPIFITHPATGQ